MFKKIILFYFIFISCVLKSNDFTFILFGATGDLACRNLIPSMYNLYEQKKINNFAIVGVALPSTNVRQILQDAKQFIPKYDENIFKEFESKFDYVQLDINNENDYKRLLTNITDIEHKFNLSGNRLFYCATCCSYFETITKYLVKNGILEKNTSNCWNKIVYEKPFGFDLNSARQMNKSITSLINTNQIIYMDHFLFTKTMNHVFSFRFMNPIFKNIWNNSCIESLHILLNETLSVGTRGKMYDKIGALLDVIQNHMFQMLTLATINEPKDLKNIMAEKNLLLKKTKFVNGILGQYKDYHKELDVPENSNTETFASLRFEIDSPEWKDVPIYLTSGKCLDKTEICIRVIFKDKNSEDKNILNIWLAPTPSYELKMNVKKINIDQETTDISLVYEYPQFDTYSTETYIFILEEIIKGNNFIALDFEEIETAWQLIDTIKNSNLKLYQYDKYSSGPHPYEL